MKLHEEFQVAEPADSIWKFFEQPERVARCMPGVEAVQVLDEDNVTVRATQSIGPMTATFEAKVTVLDRVPGESIRFQAIGRSVRGAVGHLRAVNEVHLIGADGSTTISVDGEVVLAGALGSVGQKIVARQAGKVTAAFADNLRAALTGGTQPAAAMAQPAATAQPLTALAGAGGPVAPAAAPSGRPDPWSRVAAGLSAASVVLSLITLVRSLRGTARRRPRGRR